MKGNKSNKRIIKFSILLCTCLLIAATLLIGHSLIPHINEPAAKSVVLIKKNPSEPYDKGDPDSSLDKDLMIQSQLKPYNYSSCFSDNIHFTFEDKAMNFKNPVYVYCNRYYIPLDNVIDNLHGSINRTQNNLSIRLNAYNVNIDTKKGMVSVNDDMMPLRSPLKEINKDTYVSLIDFTSLFNIITSWDYKSKTISLYYNRNNIISHVFNKMGRPAYIRFEDISVDGRYATADALEKLRLLGDYLYSEGVPFHVAWVPRYMNPPYGIDNDLSKDYSIYNADFLFTLDYLIDRGALIGLHGYTHQNGNERSIDGIEFDKNHNYTSVDIKQRLTAALKCAEIINIPVSFFETPHYAALYEHHKVMEQYFSYMYEPLDSKHNKDIYLRKSGDNTIRYIPTPLDYVNGANDTDNMINKINSLGKDTIGSFFYHPSIEFPFIKLIKKKGTSYPYYIYPSDTPLHRILDTFKKDGFKFQRITSA